MVTGANTPHEKSNSHLDHSHCSIPAPVSIGLGGSAYVREGEREFEREWEAGQDEEEKAARD